MYDKWGMNECVIYLDGCNTLLDRKGIPETRESSSGIKERDRM